MHKPEIHTGIIGCGKMGKDLFDWLTGFPFAITWVCHTEEKAGRLKEAFVKKQNRALKYGLTDKETISFRTKNTVITSQLEKLTHCDIVLETITEDVDRKRALFRQLELILPKMSVLASNTSSIPPDKLFSGLTIERNSLGLHFFSPVAMKNMVEINVAPNTSTQAVAKTEEFLKRTNKFYLKLTENDHFIINRIFLKMQAGCCRLLREGAMEVQEIDTLVKKHLFPIGVFEFFDYVGNDVMWQSVKNYMAYEKNPDFYRPMIEILEQKVKEEKLGKKTKEGFYDYPVKTASSNTEITPKQQDALLQITRWYLDGVFDVLNRKICIKKELEFLVTEYMQVEKSPFDLAKEVGYLRQ